MKFAYCEALYVFATLHHSGQASRIYAYHSTLARLGYSPGLSAQRGRLEDPQARRYYRALCARHAV